MLKSMKYITPFPTEQVFCYLCLAARQFSTFYYCRCVWIEDHCRICGSHAPNYEECYFMGNATVFICRSSLFIYFFVLLLRTERPRGWSSFSGRVKNFLSCMSCRPALGPVQPPIQWVQRALLGQGGRVLKLITHLQLVPRSRKRGTSYHSHTRLNYITFNDIIIIVISITIIEFFCVSAHLCILRWGDRKSC
jgi:hypothetical protein